MVIPLPDQDPDALTPPAESVHPPFSENVAEADSFIPSPRAVPDHLPTGESANAIEPISRCDNTMIIAIHDTIRIHFLSYLLELVLVGLEGV